MNLEIVRTAIISAAHMTKADSELLERGLEPVGFLFKTGYGYCFMRETLDEDALLGDDRLSLETLNNLKLIFDSDPDLNRVEFDQDGEHVEGLERFEW